MFRVIAGSEVPCARIEPQCRRQIFVRKVVFKLATRFLKDEGVHDTSFEFMEVHIKTPSSRVLTLRRDEI